jgi:hypothetical protein
VAAISFLEKRLFRDEVKKNTMITITFERGSCEHVGDI